MATQKIDKSSGILDDIAKELGISPDKLASMDVDKIRALIESGDLDPAQKARLVRAKLRDAVAALDLVDEVLGDDIDDSDDMPAPKRGGRSKAA